MSEVDRLSNSGLYPALPIADKRSFNDDKDRRQRSDQGPDSSGSKSVGTPDSPGAPRPPKSLIDDYA
jgi:hypothetical protein